MQRIGAAERKKGGISGTTSEGRKNCRGLPTGKEQRGARFKGAALKEKHVGGICEENDDESVVLRVETLVFKCYSGRVHSSQGEADRLLH